MDKKKRIIMAKVIRQQTQPDLAQSYDLIIADLIRKLVKMKEGVIELGDLGTFHKKQRIIKSALNGRTYAYYQVSFKASNTLKKELDK
jgi:nucleoid DNA-binding protein